MLREGSHPPVGTRPNLAAKTHRTTVELSLFDLSAN